MVVEGRSVRTSIRIGVAGILAAAAAALGCGGTSRQDSPERPPRTSGERPRARGFDPALAARLQKTLDAVRDSQGIPGASAAVVLPDGLWTGASGEADR